jgi:hypothetical protein
MQTKKAINWTDELTGLRCRAVLVGFETYPDEWWCGYVAVLPGHPLHGKSYSERVPVKDRSGIRVDMNTAPIATFLEATSEDDGKCSLDVLIQVHGGLTFSERMDDWGITDAWWLGFDCHHWNDSSAVQDEAYTVRQCTSLAAQLAAFEKGVNSEADIRVAALKEAVAIIDRKIDLLCEETLASNGSVAALGVPHLRTVRNEIIGLMNKGL